jgi:hypothetical protein
MAIPRVQHDHEVFSSTASQMAILGVAAVAIMIIAWLYG